MSGSDDLDQNVWSLLLSSIPVGFKKNKNKMTMVELNFFIDLVIPYFPFLCRQRWPGIPSMKVCLPAEALTALCSSGTLGNEDTPELTLTDMKLTHSQLFLLFCPPHVVMNVLVC